MRFPVLGSASKGGLSVEKTSVIFPSSPLNAESKISSEAVTTAMAVMDSQVIR